MIDAKMTMETQKFNSWLNKTIKSHNVSTGVAIKKIGFDLLENILRPEPYGRHPIDTGRSQAGWYASVKGLGKDYNFGSGPGVEQGKREGSFVDKTGALFSNKYIEFINGVRYIVYLEYGHSEQAPAGMVRISMRKMTGKLPKEINDRFKKDWNKFRVI